MPPKKLNIIHLISHPIQYQAPLYARIATDADINFRVLFCSKKGSGTTLDAEFGVNVEWDIPILRGYNFKFLKNYARQESLDTFWGLMNFGVIRELCNAPKNSILWLHGWSNLTLILALFFGKMMGHTIYLRGESTAIIEQNKLNNFSKKVKTFFNRQILFRLTDRFLAVGNQNKAYFKMMGVPDSKIVFAPYCVDNQRFTHFFENNKNNISNLKTQLNIPLSKKVIIFSGKYIDKKRPLDLLKAVNLLPNKADIFTIFVGEGNLRGEMENYVKKHHLEGNVQLTGFVNQSLMPNYYMVSDLYVMCSGMYETWGLSTNEAMCFGLPIIVSDRVGSAYDLVNGNGFMHPSGDVAALSKYIKTVFLLSERDLKAMKKQSFDIIQNYNYEVILSALKC